MINLQRPSTHRLRQGASVADVFLNEPNWRIRGLTRDTSKPTTQALVGTLFRTPSYLFRTKS